jgi:8-oxo-dGTP diphosphatase
MKDERFRVRAAVYLILMKEDQVLLLRRYNTGWMDGHYSLIAGHLDGNEPITDAMIREAEEEARITIAKEDLIPATVIHRTSTDQEYIDFFFVAKKWQGEPKIGEPNKCDALTWYPLNKLPENILPHITAALESYNKKIPFTEFGWRI